MAPRKKASKEPDDLDIALEQHLTYTTELVSGAGGHTAILQTLMSMGSPT